METIPIFIITFERLEILKQSIQSYYDYIKTPFEIVIIDFGSSYEPTLEFLKQLEHKKVKVYWEDKINHKKYLSLVGGAIRDYFKNHPKSNYIVTDPDIALDNVDGDILEVYTYLLENLPTIPIVGPVLRIDDIPNHFPTKQGLIRGEMKVNSKRINTIQYEGKVIRYVHSYIDTTFGMYRAETYWRRPKRARRAIRILSPYAAKHLDWYLDPKNLTEDYKYYIEHASEGISHCIKSLK